MALAGIRNWEERILSPVLKLQRRILLEQHFRRRILTSGGKHSALSVELIFRKQASYRMGGNFRLFFLHWNLSNRKERVVEVLDTLVSSLNLKSCETFIKFRNYIQSFWVQADH